MEYASNGKGNLGVTLGAIGTGLGVLNGGLGGILGGFGANPAAAAAMNMVYSDYFSVAKKHGVNTVEFFADMTDAFLDDKDAGAPEEKISAYYHCVVLPQNLPQE